MSEPVHLKPSARRVLHALQVVGNRGATTHELCQPHVGGVRFSARVHEIRGAGFRIDEKREGNGSRYTLLEHNEARGQEAA